jgi:hypothetical protein
MISGGLFLFTYKATEFNFLGFILVLTASFTRLVMGMNYAFINEIQEI